MNINILINSVPHFGKYSGYECLRNYFSADSKITTTFSPDNKLIRALGKTVNFCYNNKFTIRNDGVWAAYKFLQKANRNDVSHIMYGDSNILFFKEFVRKKKNLVGTIHFPLSRWKQRDLDDLRFLKNGIILYEQEIEHFGRYTDAPFKFIRHGVDTDFFKPAPAVHINRKKILVVGAFLRNFEMLLNVYRMVEREIATDYEYHFIIPADMRGESALITFSTFENVFFHEKLTDEQLLWHHQTSNVLMMPVNESGANTGIIQAISVGLPILTTDVGGVRSYGGGSVFPVVKNNDTVAMVELFHRFVSDENYRKSIAENQREFALKYMDWKHVAAQHIDYYRSTFNLSV